MPFLKEAVWGPNELTHGAMLIKYRTFQFWIINQIFLWVQLVSISFNSLAFREEQQLFWKTFPSLYLQLPSGTVRTRKPSPLFTSSSPQVQWGPGSPVLSLSPAPLRYSEDQEAQSSLYLQLPSGTVRTRKPSPLLTSSSPRVQWGPGSPVLFLPPAPLRYSEDQEAQSSLYLQLPSGTVRTRKPSPLSISSSPRVQWGPGSPVLSLSPAPLGYNEDQEAQSSLYLKLSSDTVRTTKPSPLSISSSPLVQWGPGSPALSLSPAPLGYNEDQEAQSSLYLKLSSGTVRTRKPSPLSISSSPRVQWGPGSPVLSLFQALLGYSEDQQAQSSLSQALLGYSEDQGAQSSLYLKLSSGTVRTRKPSPLSPALLGYNEDLEAQSSLYLQLPLATMRTRKPSPLSPALLGYNEDLEAQSSLYLQLPSSTMRTWKPSPLSISSSPRVQWGPGSPVLSLFPAPLGYSEDQEAQSSPYLQLPSGTVRTRKPSPLPISSSPRVQWGPGSPVLSLSQALLGYSEDQEAQSSPYLKLPSGTVRTRKPSPLSISSFPRVQWGLGSPVLSLSQAPLGYSEDQEAQSSPYLKLSTGTVRTRKPSPLSISSSPQVQWGPGSPVLSLSPAPLGYSEDQEAQSSPYLQLPSDTVRTRKPSPLPISSSPRVQWGPGSPVLSLSQALLGYSED